jgi:hypothetical protein
MQRLERRGPTAAMAMTRIATRKQRRKEARFFACPSSALVLLPDGGVAAVNVWV